MATASVNECRIQEKPWLRFTVDMIIEG